MFAMALEADDWEFAYAAATAFGNGTVGADPAEREVLWKTTLAPREPRWLVRSAVS